MMSHSQLLNKQTNKKWWTLCFIWFVEASKRKRANLTLFNANIYLVWSFFLLEQLYFNRIFLVLSVFPIIDSILFACILMGSWFADAKQRMLVFDFILKRRELTNGSLEMKFKKVNVKQLTTDASRNSNTYFVLENQRFPHVSNVNALAHKNFNTNNFLPFFAPELEE